MKTAMSGLIGAGLGAALLCACMTNQSAGGRAENTDLFPKPLGEKIIPLEQEVYSNFHYVEMESTGVVVMQVDDLTLRITKRGDNLFGYSFEDPNRGYLIVWNDGGNNRDSAGVYIVGNFRDTANFLDSVPVLWLPQLPKLGKSWRLDSSATMELVSPDTAFYTETLFAYPPETDNSPVSQGFQCHSTVLFRETRGDTLTYYHFRRGVGLLGFERSLHGRLLASGTITSFFGRITGLTN